MVVDVHQSKKEGRQPSEEKLRQGCAESRLYCQRWDLLKIGQDGLLTMTLAGNDKPPGEKEGGLPNSHTLGVDMGNPQAGSRRSSEAACQITAPVVLA